MSAPSNETGQWEKPTLFAFASAASIVLLAVAWFDKHPSQTSWHIYNSILAIAAGGIAALMPGTLSLNWPGGIKAAGALAVAVLVFYVGKDMAPVEHFQDLRSRLIWDRVFPCIDVFSGQELHADGSQAKPASPDLPLCADSGKTSDYYVRVNSSIVAKDIETEASQSTSGDRPKVDVVRDEPVRVEFSELKPGDKIVVFQRQTFKTQEQWWTSNELIVPSAELQMSPTNYDAVKNKIK